MITNGVKAFKNVKSTLFNNANFHLATIGAYKLSKTLKTRYEMFKKELIPKIIDHAQSRLHSKINHIVLTGSAASFHNYHNIDINIVVDQANSFKEEIGFFLPDKLDSHIRKSVNLFYMDYGNMDLYNFAVKLYSRPILWGEIPANYDETEVIKCLHYTTIQNILKHKRNHKKSMRRLNHSLFNSLRYLYIINNIVGTNLSGKFKTALESVYKMEGSGTYNKDLMWEIRTFLQEWSLNLRKYIYNGKIQ